MCSSSMCYLLAVHTVHGKLLLVAGHTVVLVLLRDEALGANGLLASLAGEAGLVPAVPLVLHFPGAFRKKMFKLTTNSKIPVNSILS